MEDNGVVTVLFWALFCGADVLIIIGVVALIRRLKRRRNRGSRHAGLHYLARCRTGGCGKVMGDEQ